MKWFTDASAVEELRKQYRDLMKKHHPDVGGDTEDAKQINAEYDRLFALLSRQDSPKDTAEDYDPAEENEAFKDILGRVVTLDVTTEIIGTWVWITAGSYPYRELLKAMGFKYAPKKKAWCWHYGEYRRHHKREISMDEIRAKYGSQTVRSRRDERRTALQ